MDNICDRCGKWTCCGKHGNDSQCTCPPVHLHTPMGRTYCGAPVPEDRVNGWTAYRSDCTCEACLATLRPV